MRAPSESGEFFAGGDAGAVGGGERCGSIGNDGEKLPVGALGFGVIPYPPIDVDCLRYSAPCTALGCIELLDRYGVDLTGKRVTVLGRSNIVGLPLALMCLHRDATLTVCHNRTAPELVMEECRRADVLIVAVGSPELVKGSWIKPGAVVIDIGFNFVPDPQPERLGTGDDGSGSSGVTGDGENRSVEDREEDNGETRGRVCGDVAFEEALKVASLVTPVPGGVGPMTVAMLMKNTLNSFLLREGGALSKLPDGPSSRQRREETQAK